MTRVSWWSDNLGGRPGATPLEIRTRFTRSSPADITPSPRPASPDRRRGRRLPRRAAPLMLARLAHPNPGPFVLERRRLFQSLNEHADRPLTLVVAEAG